MPATSRFGKDHPPPLASIRLAGTVVAALALLTLGAGSGAASASSPASASAAGTGESSADLAEPSASSGCPSTACSSVLAEVAGAAKIKTLPANLTPQLQNAESDLSRPPGGKCGNLGLAGVEPEYEPCTWGSSQAATKIVLLGESHAWQWSTPIESIAQKNGDSFALLYHASCNVVPTAGSLPVQGIVGQAPPGAVCAQWTEAALKWINAYKPQVVIVATLNGFDTEQHETAYLKGLREDFQALKAPGRRLIMLRDMPLPNPTVPQCLAAHESDVQACSGSEPVAVQNLLRFHSYDRQAALLSRLGASVVNVIPWFCTTRICPAVIGNFEVYEDPYHATTTYAEHLAPVLAVALGLGAPAS
jgi:SGNH domain (fused to AT3 domains)